MDLPTGFSDLGGQLLRVAITSQLTRTTMISNTTEPYDESYSQEQSFINIFDLLSSRMNFTYQLIIPSGVPYTGIKEANGSFTGLMSLLERKEVDILADHIPILNSYRDMMDFSIPLKTDKWVTLQKQSAGSISMAGLTSPFKPTVWLFVALSMICMIPMMYITYRIYLKFQPKSIKTFQGRLSDFTMFVVFSLLKQDHKLRTAIHSQRVLMVTWWIGGILLTTFYTAHLTASLARPIKAKPIQTPEELLQTVNQQVRWVILEGGPYHGKIIEDMNKDVQRRLIEDLKTGRGTMVSSIESAIQFVENEGYIWFGPSMTLFNVVITDYLSKQKKKEIPVVCSFLMTDERTPYLTIDYGLGFSKNSSLTIQFNQALQKIVEMGFFDKKNTGIRSNPCSQHDGGYTTEITMHVQDFIGLFGVTIGGIALSAVTFVGERIYFSLKQSGEQEVNIRTKAKVQRPLRRISQPVTMEPLNGVNTQEIQKLKITIANIIKPPYRTNTADNSHD